MIGLAIVAEGPRHLCITVKQAQMGAWIKQGQMFGLPMDIHQQGAQLLEQRDVDRPAVDAGHTASFLADLAHEHHVVGIVHQLFPLQDGVHRLLFGTFELEHTLDKRGIRIGAHKGRIRLAADQHDHGIQNNGLARACFTGQDDQAGAKTKIEFVDDGKIMDMEFCKHKKRV